MVAARITRIIRDSFDTSIEEHNMSSSDTTIEGVYNFRDIAVGPTMRPRFIYRSSNIKVATDLGMQQLAALGVTTLIDVRSTKERLAKGNTAVPESIADLHYPLFLADKTEILDNTVIQFLSFLIQGPTGFAELFMVVCDNVFLVKTQWLPYLNVWLHHPIC